MNLFSRFSKFYTIFLLNYFSTIYKIKIKELFFNENTYNFKKRIATNILLNQKFSPEFKFLFTFDRGFLLLALKFRVLMIIDNERLEKIKERIINYKVSLLKSKKFIFVYMITIFVYENKILNKILFVYDYEKLIFEKVR